MLIFEGAVGYKHIGQLRVAHNVRPCTLVTAAVNQMNVYKSPTTMDDLFMQGNVIWVGKSSILSRIEVLQGNFLFHAKLLLSTDSFS